MLRGEGACRRDRLGTGEQRDPDRPGEQPLDVRKGDARHAHLGHLGRDLPELGDTVAVRVEQAGREDPRDDRDQRRRQLWRDSLQNEDQRKRPEPEHDRPAGNDAEVGELVPDELEEVPGAAGNAEQGRDLASHDHQRQTDHVPGQHGLRQELGNEAETRDPGEHEQAACHQRQQRREVQEPIGIPCDDRCDRGSREDRDPRARTDVQLATRPQERVQKEPRARGVQPPHGRHTRERCVGHRLRHQNSPDRQSGQRVPLHRQTPGRQPTGRRDRPDDQTADRSGAQPHLRATLGDRHPRGSRRR